MKLTLAILLVASASAAGFAQAPTAKPYAWETGAGYDFVHSNAPPSGCGCFSMNGGSSWAVRQFSPHFGMEAEFNGVFNANVNATGRSLTLLTYVAGPRYRVLRSDGRFDPYGKVLLGGAHASGGVYGNTGATSTGTANGFAASIGGGLDVKLTEHVSLRLVEADYLLTLLPNGVNSRQNNVSLRTGIEIRFGR